MSANAILQAFRKDIEIATSDADYVLYRVMTVLNEELKIGSHPLGSIWASVSNFYLCNQINSSIKETKNSKSYTYNYKNSETVKTKTLSMGDYYANVDRQQQREQYLETDFMGIITLNGNVDLLDEEGCTDDQILRKRVVTCVTHCFREQIWRGKDHDIIVKALSSPEDQEYVPDAMAVWLKVNGLTDPAVAPRFYHLIQEFLCNIFAWRVSIVADIYSLKNPPPNVKQLIDQYQHIGDTFWTVYNTTPPPPGFSNMLPFQRFLSLGHFLSGRTNTPLTIEYGVGIGTDENLEPQRLKGPRDYGYEYVKVGNRQGAKLTGKCRYLPDEMKRWQPPKRYEEFANALLQWHARVEAELPSH